MQKCVFGTIATRPRLHTPIGHCPRSRPSRFIYGYAVQLFSPANCIDVSLSSRAHISAWTDASGDEHLVHRDVVSLEVGDNVYAFEKYTPRDKEVEGVWYRG